MGVSDIEKILKKDEWLTTREIAEKAGLSISTVNVLANKLVNKWHTVETKKELVDHCWRAFFKLKED